MGKNIPPTSTNKGNLIHVDFGSARRLALETPELLEQPNKSSTDSLSHPPADAQTHESFPPVTIDGEPLTDHFFASEVCRLMNITQGQLRSLDRTGIVSPSARRKGRRAYTFQDLIAVRTALQLKQHNVRLRDVSRAVEKLKQLLPKVTRPLSQLRVVSDGTQLVVRTSTGAFEPTSGQMLLDFDVESLRKQVVRMLRPKVSPQRSRCAFELYEQASALDEDPRTFAQAEKLYREAIEQDPYLAIAYTNLGNIYFRQKNESLALQMYDKALQLDPQQSEAHYNLGYVMLERGDPKAAVPYFQAAIAADPKFSDAYFNLAMALEQLGQEQQARPCWKRYVQLEPNGTWSDIARKHLG